MSAKTIKSEPAPKADATSKTEAKVETKDIVVEKSTVKIGRAVLQSALKEACYFADAKSTMPVLAKVLLRPTDLGVLLVAATDLNRTVAGSIRAEVRGSTDAAVDARKMLEVLKAVSGLDVELEIEHRGTLASVTIACGRSKFKLPAQRGRDFPKIPAANPAELASLVGLDSSPLVPFPADALARLLSKTEPTVSRDETRAHLNSVHFEVADGTARMVSTDGHRLAKVEQKVSTRLSLPRDKGALIQLRSIADLERLLKNCTGKRSAALELAVVRGMLYASHSFDGVSWLHSFRLAETQFPPYEQVIPRDSQHSVECNREDLIETFKRLAVTASKTTGGCKISVPQRSERRYDGSSVTITLATDDGDGNSGSEQIDLVASGFAYYKPRSKKDILTDEVKAPVETEAPVYNFGVNLRYLVDALTQLEGSLVRLSFNGELDPLTVQSVNADDGVMMVVMPMRL